MCTVLYCIYRETDRRGNREWMDGREHEKREPRIIIIEIKTPIRIMINMKMGMGVAPPSFFLSHIPVSSNNPPSQVLTLVPGKGVLSASEARYWNIQKSDDYMS